MYREYPATKILDELGADNLLPAILFRTARKQCDKDVEAIADSRTGGIGIAEGRRLAQQVQKIIQKYDMDENIIKEHPHYDALLTTGVGAHHAGQLLLWRLLLEELMSSSMLRLMVATGTVAAGVDFPARTVVITAHSKRGAEGFNTLSSSEFQQMSGRAGRRGKDSVGMCLIAPGHFSDARVFHDVANSPSEPLKSAYFASPSTILNLLKFRSVDELRYMVNKSLASFLDRKAAKELRSSAQEIEGQLLQECPEGTQSNEGDEEIAAVEEEDNYSQADAKTSGQKKLEKRVRRILREAEQLEQRQLLQLELSLNGLRALKHLDESGLTEKGSWAAELCTGLVLQLAEAIEEGMLFDVQEFELIGLVASIAGDSHRVYFRLAQNPIEKGRYAELLTYVERVRDKYDGPTTTKDSTVLPDAALTVLAWWEAEDWPAYASLLRLAGVAEGDAARVITQTADHLHQLSRLIETHPDLARLAIEARKKLLRPPLSEGIVIGVDTN